MIAHNSEVYNPPYRDLLPKYVYSEERYVGGIVYFTVLCDHPYLVSLATFCCSGIPTSRYCNILLQKPNNLNIPRLCNLSKIQGHLPKIGKLDPPYKDPAGDTDIHYK